MAILIVIFVTVSYLMFTSLVGDFYFRNFMDHPTPETIWTIVPAVVLLFIVFPSLRLLYVMYEVMNPSITLKAVGNQLY